MRNEEKSDQPSNETRQSLAALTVNCLPTLDLADRRAEAAAREANMLMLSVTYYVVVLADRSRIKDQNKSGHRQQGRRLDEQTKSTT